MTAFVLAALLAGAIIPDPDLAGAERQVADKIAACRRFVASHPPEAHGTVGERVRSLTHLPLTREVSRITLLPGGKTDASPERKIREKAMRTLSMKVPDGLDRDLGALAKRRGISKSALVRDAMSEIVARERVGADRPPAGSFLALAEDLAGCVEAPEDLSTNKSYLDDYGR